MATCSSYYSGADSLYLPSFSGTHMTAAPNFVLPKNTPTIRLKTLMTSCFAPHFDHADNTWHNVQAFARLVGVRQCETLVQVLVCLAMKPRDKPLEHYAGPATIERGHTSSHQQPSHSGWNRHPSIRASYYCYHLLCNSVHLSTVPILKP